jgi:hypothetical protein
LLNVGVPYGIALLQSWAFIYLGAHPLTTTALATLNEGERGRHHDYLARWTFIYLTPEPLIMCCIVRKHAHLLNYIRA